MSSNIRNINCGGHTFSFDTYRHVPELSEATTKTLEKIYWKQLLSRNQIHYTPLPRLGLDENLNLKMGPSPNTPLAFKEDLIRVPRGLKVLINTILLGLLITCILLFLASPHSGFLIFAIGFLGFFWCFACTNWMDHTIKDIDIQNEWVELYSPSYIAPPFSNEECQEYEKYKSHPLIANPSQLLLFLCHLMPFTPLIEPFFHHYRYEKINKLREEVVARDFLELFEYYTTRFHKTDAQLTEWIDTNNKDYSTESLKEAREELRQHHDFYMSMAKRVRTFISEQAVSADIPKVLGGMIAEYTY